ncbi:MAG: hypothetical protein KatS3mg095_0176 [Candidatus Parcubacteria bacterium]|nr:MAG: hypothetical protein KatS3mg095_0176 [Candidatus Parcubacteria bacterium]
MNQELNEILKSLREKINLSQEELANNLKITIAQVEILEKGQFKKLPKNSLLKILKKYENFFKLKEGELSSLIKKEYLDNEDKPILNKEYYKNYNNYQTLTIKIILLIFIFITALISYQIINLLLPQIKIIYPPDGLVTNQREIKIRGYVDKRSVLYLNKDEIIYKDNGYFEKSALLNPGLNKFEFIVKNYLGGYKKIIINVYYQP